MTMDHVNYTVDQMESSIANSDLRTNAEIVLSSVICACLVGLSGILPLLIIPVEVGHALKKGAPAARLKLFLSFAAGSILGDVFLHLVPEAWMECKYSGGNLGRWILLGILAFFVIEKVFSDDDKQKEEKEKTEQEKKKHEENERTFEAPSSEVNGHTADDQSYISTRRRRGSFISAKHLHDGGSSNYLQISAINSNNNSGSSSTSTSTSTSTQLSETGSDMRGGHNSGSDPGTDKYETRGYLNLLANVIDNFTHGMAVGASFLVSRKVGLLTTFAILVHEIPHEVGDFAILLRSGFSRWDAAGAQMLTASGGMVGAVTALWAGTIGDFTGRILAFTSGGFIYIAMVTVLPDLLKEDNNRESLKQVIWLCVGICVMAVVNGAVI